MSEEKGSFTDRLLGVAERGEFDVNVKIDDAELVRVAVTVFAAMLTANIVAKMLVK